MSSEFLVIIPTGWIQLDWDYIANNVPHAARVNGGTLLDVEESLRDAGIIAPELSLTAFKLIDDSYLLVKLA